MRHRAFASLLAIATVAALALTAAHAEPLSIDACKDLKTELAQLESGGITRALDEGPEWATKNLSGEQLDRAKRYVHVDEVVRFRCPEREQLEKGEIPPLPVVAPNRAKKIKEIEALAAEAAKRPEAEKLAEKAEAAKQEAARQAEAEKGKAAEAEGARKSESDVKAVADEDEGKDPRDVAGAREKAAAAAAAGAVQPDSEKPVLKMGLDGKVASPPAGDAGKQKPAPGDRAPLSADGIAPREKESPEESKPPQHQRASRAEPVQAVPVDPGQPAQSFTEAGAKQAGADEDSWFSFFRRSFP